MRGYRLFVATIYLIRHGETDWNVERRVMGRRDTPLNRNGMEQAMSIAQVLKKFPIQRVYSSPQMRAFQTAEHVAGLHKLKVEKSDSLAEVDFRAWEGKHWEELQKIDSYHLYRGQPETGHHPDFEPIADVQKRTWGFVEKLANETPDGHFAMVSHADPIRTILSRVVNQPLSNYRVFRILNASLSILSNNSGPWVLWLYNYRSSGEFFSEL